MSTYFILKTLHILSSVLLVGTGLGSAFYMYQLNRVKNIEVIRSVNKQVVLADYLFTIPSLIFQPLSGWALLKILNIPWSSFWVYYSLILYSFSFLCWLPAYFLQIKLMRLAKETPDYLSLSPNYKKYLNYWVFLGLPSFIAMLSIFYLMVAKPSGS